MAQRTFLAFGCVHRPIHDEEGCEWVIEQVAERQPDFLICLGDLFDAESLSSFAKSESKLQDEYDSAELFLTELHDASPKSKKVWLEGNHEQRIRRLEHRHIAELIDYRKQIGEAKRWKHIDYRYAPEGTFTLGQLTFYHGFVCGRNSVKDESIKLGIPNGCTISAHVHRPHPLHRISKGTTPLPYWHVNTGTFINPDVEYMQTRDTSLWGQGIAVGNVETKRRFDGKQNWEVEMLLRKMYWSEDAHYA